MDKGSGIIRGCRGIEERAREGRVMPKKVVGVEERMVALKGKSL